MIRSSIPGGLTYAEYVHQGFGQLTVATLLTLAVVAVAARKAPRSSGRERLLLRAVLGALCLLTLVVVASALYRMHVYEEAYGFTRLRLLVSVFEGWLGLVVLMVLGAGVRLRGSWVPRTVLLSGAASLLALAALSPDAYIARHNVDRFAETGKIDVADPERALGRRRPGAGAGRLCDTGPGRRRRLAGVEPRPGAGGVGGRGAGLDGVHPAVAPRPPVWPAGGPGTS